MARGNRAVFAFAGQGRKPVETISKRSLEPGRARRKTHGRDRLEPIVAFAINEQSALQQFSEGQARILDRWRQAARSTPVSISVRSAAKSIGLRLQSRLNVVIAQGRYVRFAIRPCLSKTLSFEGSTPDRISVRQFVHRFSVLRLRGEHVAPTMFRCAKCDFEFDTSFNCASVRPPTSLKSALGQLFTDCGRTS